MATDSVGVLRSELDILLTQIEELEDKYADEQFPDEERERYNRLNTSVEDYKKRIELAQREERRAELKAIGRTEGNSERIGVGLQVAGSQWRDDPHNFSTIDREFGNPAKEGQQLKDRARHVVESKLSFRASGVDPDTAKEHVSKLVEEVDMDDGRLSRHLLANSSPTYKRAFGKYLAGEFLSSDEGGALSQSRALSLTGSAGGFAVPVELDPTIIPTSNLTLNPFRGIARVIPVTVDTWNGVSAGAVAASYAAEATPTTDSSPTLAQVAISTEKATSFIPFSIEIGQDWGALQSEMGRLLADAKDVLEATKFTLGSGTNEPFGVITGATNLYTAASTTALAVADLYGLEVALPPRFRGNASMLFTRAVAQKIRGFDTGTGAGSGSNVWVDNLRLGLGNQVPSPAGYNANVLGYPSYESFDMSSTFTTGQKLMLFGDFKQYIIIDRIGMNIETIPMLFDVTFNQPTGQRGLYAYWRNGAKVATAQAFVALRLA